MGKTVFSFYCDDTSPFTSPPGAFKTFLDFASSEGIAGESSVILAFDWAQRGKRLHQPTTFLEREYIRQLQRAPGCGIEANFELMTHAGRYDFERQLIPEGVQHEGVWLYEPAISVAEYEAYFSQIVNSGEEIGVHFSGLTQPGCGCLACSERHQQLHSGDQSQPNPNVFQALWNLGRLGKLRGSSAACFFGGALDHCCAEKAVGGDGFSVYNLHPNLRDHFGSWRNLPEDVAADYYITADGSTGKMVELVQSGAPYALFYAHWQGLNPGNGIGWQAFTQVVRRLDKHLGGQIEWLSPSQFSARLETINPS